MEKLLYNMLVLWFVPLCTDDPIWHLTTLINNRERLLYEEIKVGLLKILLAWPEDYALLSNEHFLVYGILLAGLLLLFLDGVDDCPDEPPPPPPPCSGVVSGAQ